jgi:hypothetical protein
MLANTVGAITTDVQFHSSETESFGQLWWWRRRHVQANDASAIGATEMHVLRMLDVGLCRSKTEDAACVGGLVCQTNICEPIKNPVEGYPIHFRVRILAQLPLNIAMAQWSMCCLEQADNTNAGRRYACSRCAKGGLDGRERRIGLRLHADI